MLPAACAVTRRTRIHHLYKGSGGDGSRHITQKSITKTGGRQYLQLVVSFRNDRGQVRVRVIANHGRLDDLTPEKLEPLINGPNRAVGRAENTASEVIHEPGRSFGDVFALQELWCELGIGTTLKRTLRSSRREFDAEALVRAMVFNEGSVQRV